MKKNEKKTAKSFRKQEEILKVRVDSTHINEVLRQIKWRLTDFKYKSSKYSKFYIVTPNPEQVLMAQEDVEFLNILNKADISLPDGIGLAQAVAFSKISVPKNRIFKAILLFLSGLSIAVMTVTNRKKLLENLNILHGGDVFLDLIRLANNKGWKVVLLGGADNVAERSALILKKNYLNLKVMGLTGPTIPGSSWLGKLESVSNEEILAKINKFRPHLLFVGFGAPKQEKWLYKNIKSLDIGGAMVLGGIFDYMTGKVRKPPKFVKNTEFEWLWRLITQGRIKRVFRAVILFPWKVFQSRIKEN